MSASEIYIDFYGAKPVYRPGDRLEVVWTVDILKTISVKNVSISFNGAALTRFTNGSDCLRADDKIGYENITTKELVVFPETNSLGNTFEYPAGRYVYKFSVEIPRKNIPPSFEGKYGAIRYWLSLDITRPGLRSHIKKMSPITVLNDIDVSLSAYSNSVSSQTEKIMQRALFCGIQGMVTLFAQTDRGAYCPGENIIIKYTVENSSDKDLGRIKIELIQKVTFRPNGEEIYKYLCLSSVNGDEVKKGRKLCSPDSKCCITVPAVPPSTNERDSYVIEVQYYVKVTVHIPKFRGGDAIVLLPIAIGTIPQGHTAVPKAEVQGAGNVPDEAPEIIYIKCTAGYEDGPGLRDNKKFPRCTYVPWCAYVTDFKPRVTRKTGSYQNIKKQMHPESNKNSGDSKPPPNNVKEAVIEPHFGNQQHEQPTAPPLDLYLPSYSEALSEMTLQKPDETTGNRKYLADIEVSDDKEKTWEQ